jgi:hypothetical protein
LTRPYYEIEECHRRADTVNVVNLLTVFEFDGERKTRFAVSRQQPAAATDRRLA